MSFNLQRQWQWCNQREDQPLLCALDFPNLTLQLQLNQMMLQKKRNGKKKEVGKWGLTQPTVYMFQENHQKELFKNTHTHDWSYI